MNASSITFTKTQQKDAIPQVLQQIHTRNVRLQILQQLKTQTAKDTDSEALRFYNKYTKIMYVFNFYDKDASLQLLQYLHTRK
jgi:hypothetical protein